MFFTFRQRAERFYHSTIAIIVLWKGLFLIGCINSSLHVQQTNKNTLKNIDTHRRISMHVNAHWRTSTDIDARPLTTARPNTSRKYRCCPWKCAGESQLDDFTITAKIWRLANHNLESSIEAKTGIWSLLYSTN